MATYYLGAKQTNSRTVQTWSKPLYEAFLAGAWYLFWTDQTLYWVAKPGMYKNERGQLHNAAGPALWSDVEPFWFWRGVLVTEQIVLAPNTLTPEQIAKETNVQVRQVMVERVGIERVCQMFQAQCVDKRGDYELLALNLGDGRIRPYLKMLNPSMPGIYHVEGVAPNITTVQEALNWRNGFSLDQIDEINGVEFWQQGDVILKPKGAKAFKSQPTILT